MRQSDDFRDVLAEVTEQFLRDFGWKDPWQINRGECENWAVAVAHRLELLDIEATVVCEELKTCGHAFVYCEGLYYDSECQMGVEDWQQLPIFRQMPQLLQCRPLAIMLKEAGVCDTPTS